MSNIKVDMSKQCGLKYEEYWDAANHYRTMPQSEWLKWYSDHCGKCEYMGEVCMYGEE